MKQSAPERASSLRKISFYAGMASVFLISSVSPAQLVTEVPLTPVGGGGATMGSSGAGLNGDIIQQGQYDMANRAYADAVLQQQTLLAQQQAAAAQQAALLAQQQALNPPAPATNNTAGLIGLCGSMLSSLSSTFGAKNTKSTKEFTKAMDDYNESLGNQYSKNIPEEVSKKVASDSYDAESVKKYGASAGLCNSFMSKDGKIGPLGRVVESAIEQHPQSFENKNLRDLNEMCPKYNSMEPAQKKLFWIRFFSILAYKESSCDPKKDNVPSASNKNSPPNGTAFGLFQLDKNAKCGDIDYHNASANTRCAVNRMAKEMAARSTLSSPCSNTNGCAKHGVSVKQATYWGELRNDDNNPGRKGDTRAAIGLRRAVSTYTYCH